MKDDSIQFQLVITKEDLEQEKESKISNKDLKFLDSKSLDKGSDSQLSPLIEAQFVEILVVTIATTLAALTARIADHWLKKRENGLLIDYSEDPPLISLVRNIPQNTIVIINKDESKVYPPPENEKFTKKMIKKILKKQLVKVVI